mmetsp:Transcript_12236/g.14746  ORF Transcript_12236/g.14746 Transcript_12236/m.14746 type:complete len:95 (+) Transcript_12236:404-688(+)
MQHQDQLTHRARRARHLDNVRTTYAGQMPYFRYMSTNLLLNLPPHFKSLYKNLMLISFAPNWTNSKCTQSNKNEAFSELGFKISTIVSYQIGKN